MIISHLKLKNWKNFRNVDIPLRQRVFVVGANASGKSNFLDVFRFLRDIVKQGGGLQKAVSDRKGIPKIRCYSARIEPQIEIEVQLSDDFDTVPRWKYSLGLVTETGGKNNPIILHEKIWKGEILIKERPDNDDIIDSLRKTQTHLEQITANQSFREISDYFKSICYLNVIPHLLRHPEFYIGPEAQEDLYGRTFIDKVASTPDKTRNARLKKIEQALRIAVPQLKELSLSYVKNVPHLEAVYEHWRPKAGKQTEEQFSDGTIRLIGFLWSLLEGDSLLLLEEPEISIHAELVRKFPGLISRFQQKKKRQIIISTHSSDLLSDSGIGGEETLLLLPDKKECTKIELASSIEDVKYLLQNGFTIAEAALPKTAQRSFQQLSLFNA